MIDSFQCTYETDKGKKSLRTKYGGIGGGKSSITLNPNEKIYRVEIGTAALNGLVLECGDREIHVEDAIEELKFHILDIKTGIKRICGPYGRTGCSDAMHFLKRNSDNQYLMKTKEIQFIDHYLIDIKGIGNEYITSLEMVFINEKNGSYKHIVI